MKINLIFKQLYRFVLNNSLLLISNNEYDLLSYSAIIHHQHVYGIYLNRKVLGIGIQLGMWSTRSLLRDGVHSGHHQIPISEITHNTNTFTLSNTQQNLSHLLIIYQRMIAFSLPLLKTPVWWSSWRDF